MRILLALSLLVLFTGCNGTGSRPEVSHGAVSSASRPKGVVFVANGSGDLREVSNNLRQIVNETASPLQVQTVNWSHGYQRYLIDHVDHDNHVAQGRLLADQVTEYRRAYPENRICLLGYSTGAAVVLAAAETLPTDSIDRIILLAPAVCASHDLRPALATTRDGIDVFHSKDDRLILGLGMKIVGTADGGCRKAAGQSGFTPVIVGPQDAVLYNKLRQHPWDPVEAWSGHDGGHYGGSKPEFLRAYVLPLLLRK